MPKNKKEEISDMIADQAYDDPMFKKGSLLVFENAKIKITRVDRKNKRVWGEHVVTVTKDIAVTHYGHNIDSTDETVAEHGAPYCTDCEVTLNEESTKEGKRKAEERDERTLSDGTIIE